MGSYIIIEKQGIFSALSESRYTLYVGMARTHASRNTF